jgi:hypothetical protein
MGESMMKTKQQVRAILEQHHSCCLDDDEDRERVIDALFRVLGRVETYVLGPGLSITCNEGGLQEFVFLDENERTTVVSVDELDSGWRDVLMKALE